MLTSVLIANRGEIARRINRTAQRLGLHTTAVFSDPDSGMPLTREADKAVPLQGSTPSETYLCVERIIAAAQQVDAESVHPGYGFLSENSDFAQAVLDAGLTWIGPSPESIAAMGNKVMARQMMAEAGIPVLAGDTRPMRVIDEAIEAANQLGFPIMVKAAAGGGGIGMSVARDEEALRQGFESARSRAERSFGDGQVFLERYVPKARHIEVQILGLSDGAIIALGERDCSIQRRHQKLLEETPSPGLDTDLRARLVADALVAGRAVNYRNAGTVEFLVDVESNTHYFLEMNTRLQVEHPITELVMGIDLVEQQFRIASGEDVLFMPSSLRPLGHAIEMRICAEDPVRFIPSPGVITEYREPSGPGIRVDGGYELGNEVSRFYDPLLAKLCVVAADRDSALALAREAAAQYRISGPKTNLGFFLGLLDAEEFVAGMYDTTIVERLGRAR